MQTKYLILGFYLLSSLFGILALEATPIKSFISLESSNNANPSLIRTKHGSISFTGFTDNSGHQPQYLLVDYDSRNISIVMKEISQACDIEMYAFSKLHYNEHTQDLVYYCNSNNTLLILDIDTLKVQSSIAVDLDTKFVESKLSSDGTSIAVVLLSELFALKPTAYSQLVIIDLKTKTVKSNIAFDKEIASNEIVFGFAGCGLKNYIITYVFDFTVDVNIYELLILKDSSYTLVPLHEFTWEYNWPYGGTYVSEIYCIGDLIVTNTPDEVLFLSPTEGNISNSSSLFFSGFSYNTTKTMLPQMLRGKANNTLYACLQDNQRNNYIVRFTVNGSFLSSQNITNGSQLQLAKGTGDLGDLILKYNVKTGFSQVLEADTLEIIYSCPGSFKNVFVTGSTYSIHNIYGLSIFSLHNDSLLLGNVQGINSAATTNLPLWYHDIENNLIYFINTNATSYQNCTILSLHLETTQMKNLKAFNNAENICRGRIIQVGPLTPEGKADLTIQAYDKSFLILSNTYGQLNFTAPPKFHDGFINTNFTSLTVNLLAIKYSIFGGWSLSSFEYLSEHQTFALQDTHLLGNNMSFIDGKINYNLQDGRIYSVSSQVVTIIDPISKSVNAYSFLLNNPLPSVLHNHQKGDFSTIISGVTGTPYLLQEGILSYLPGVTQTTTDARSTGACTYFTTDSFGSNAQLLKIYTTCQNKNLNIDQQILSFLYSKLYS